MNAIYLLLKKHAFLLWVCLILLIASILRFYQYGNRWGLAYDQAHDVLVARFALASHLLPLLGPFSSAGSFQTGGEWYWFIMLGTALFPFSVITPWIFLTLLSIMFVLLLILFASYFVDRRFGIIAGILAAFSSAEIAQGMNVTNQAPIAFFALIALWCMIAYIRTEQTRYIFFQALAISVAASIHLQGVALILMFLPLVLFTGVPRKKGIALLLFGLLIPWIPVLLVDSTHGFFNTAHMIQYYLHDQYKVSFDVLGRSWKTYLGIFWPGALANIVGGSILFSFFLIACLIGIFALAIRKNDVSKEWYILLISFLLMVILLRYTRTPLFDSYLMFLHPFIFLLSAFALSFFFQRNRVLGLVILSFFCFGSLQKDIHEIAHASNVTASLANQKASLLLQTFPKQKFAVYTYQYKLPGQNLPLALFLDAKGKIDDSGHRVGIIMATTSATFTYPVIHGNTGEYQLIDLNSSSSATLKKNGWKRVDPSDIYNATEEWF